MCFLRLSLGTGEKPTLQVGIISKKVAGATDRLAILQGSSPLTGNGRSQAPPPFGRPPSDPTGRTTENVNPQNLVRLRTHGTFRKRRAARRRSGASAAPPDRVRTSALRGAAGAPPPRPAPPF